MSRCVLLQLLIFRRSINSSPPSFDYNPELTDRASVVMNLDEDNAA